MQNTPQPSAGPSRFWLAALLAGLAMLGPFTIDTYMPSFPDMERTFSASAVQMQQTLSVYLLTSASMMLFHGAISDSFGRRSVILANLLVYIVASAGCALAQDFTQLLAFRGLQGLAGGSGMVIGRAMIRDSYAGHDAQRMMSMVTMLFGVAPAIAPIIGGWLQAGFGWRSVFAFLVLFGSLLFIRCWQVLPETLPRSARQPFAPRPLIANYLKLLGSPRYLLLSTAVAFNFAGFFIYISSAPAIVYGLLHLDETQFAWLFIPAVSGVVIGAFLSGRLAGRLTARTTIAIAYGLMFSAVGCSMTYHYLFPPALPWTVLFVMMYSMGMSLAMPNLTIYALDLFPQNRGLAASLQVFQQYIYTSIVAGVVSPFVSDSALGMAVTSCAFLSCGGCCAFYYFKLRSAVPQVKEQA